MKGINYLPEQQRFHVPLEQVFRDIFGDDGLVLLERVEIAVALFRGDFEADVQQLAEARIEGRVFLVVPQRVDELLGTPAVDDRCRRQFLFVNVNDRGIRRAKFVHVLQRIGVNFLGDFQAVAARFRQADEFFQPGRAGGFEVDARRRIFSTPGASARKWKTCRCRNGR